MNDVNEPSSFLDYRGIWNFVRLKYKILVSRGLSCLFSEKYNQTPQDRGNITTSDDEILSQRDK